jgi:ABC-type oligopeptide transport system substrate-binding subunit
LGWLRYVKGGSSEASNTADIVAGRADLIRLFTDQATNKQLHARHPTPLHEQVRFDTQYLTLDTRIPPFDNQNGRHAVN